MKVSLFSAVVLLIVASVYASDGPISIDNKGGYFVKFFVEYNLNGEKKYEESEYLELGVTKEIKIPDGATNGNLKVEEYWNPNRIGTIFTKSFDGPVHKCYTIWGTTRKPSYAEVNC